MNCLKQYFFVNFNDFRSLDFAIDKKKAVVQESVMWKLNRAFDNKTEVVLFFSVRESNKFQGYASMRSIIKRNKTPKIKFSAPFDVVWLEIYPVLNVEKRKRKKLYE